MEVHFFQVFFVAGILFAALRYILYMFFKQESKPNIFVWFIVAGLLCAITRSWWSSEIFIVDFAHNKDGNNKEYYVGNYNGHEIALFHKYVDNNSSDTLIAYSTKYWENEDSLEYAIILPFSLIEIDGSIDYYNYPPPKSVKVPDIPFWNPHVKRWTLCELKTYFQWIENSDEYEWEE